jgi:hypothetical protein
VTSAAPATLKPRLPAAARTYTQVAGDWDGDGRADVGVFTVAGNWSILLSTSGFTTSLTKT